MTADQIVAMIGPRMSVATIEEMDLLNAVAINLGVSPPWCATYGAYGVEIVPVRSRVITFFRVLPR